jgi:hypothetical protein
MLKIKRSRVPPGRVQTNKQTTNFFKLVKNRPRTCQLPYAWANILDGFYTLYTFYKNLA